MGPAAGVYLHNEINLLFSTLNSKDQDHPSIVHLSYPSEIPDRTEYLKNKGKINPGIMAFNLLRKHFSNKTNLILGVACNTFHADKIFRPFNKRVDDYFLNANIINIMDETIKGLNYKNTIGVLSTFGTYQFKIYEEPLIRNNFNVVNLDKFDAELAHDIVYNEKWGIKSKNKITTKAIDETLKYLLVLKRKGANQIIFGCTELPLLIDKIKIDNIEIINSTKMLAMGIVREYLTT